MSNISRATHSLCCVLLLLPVGVVAAVTGERELSEVVVTADRITQPQAEVPSSTRVLVREDLDQLPLRTMGEALASMPNVLLRQSGSLFDEGSPSMYGISGQPRAPSRTVVAIDGVPLNSGLVPETSLNLLPLGLIERVELVQGPGSAAYGSNATTGVLNLMARRPDGWLAEADLLAGERWNTQGADLRLGHGREGEYSWIAGIGRRSTDGHLQPQGRNDFSDSTLDNLAVLGERRLGVWTIDAAWLRHDFDRHDPSALEVGVPPGPTAREERGYRSHGTLGARWSADEALVAELRYTRNASSIRSAQTFRQPAVGPAAANPSNETVLNDGWLAQLLWSSGPHRLSSGIEYQSVDLENRIANLARSGNVRGAFVQYRHLSFEGRLALLAGYRYDDASTFAESSGSPKLGAVWNSADARWRWRLNLSRAFNAPTFNELFSTGRVRGNPALRAQTLRLIDTGVTWQATEALNADLSFFAAKLRDPIFPRPNPALGAGIRQFQNVGPGVDTQGIVLALDWRVDQSLRIGGSYTYLDPGSATFHTARHSAKVQAVYDPAPWYVGITARHESNRYWRDDFLNPTSDYTVADLRAGWRFSEHLSAELSLYNVTDEAYATTASIGATTSVDLPSPARHAMMQINARF